MFRLTTLTLLDALMQGDERMKSIRNLSIDYSTPHQNVVSSDQYSVEIAATIKGKNVILKAFFDATEKRSAKILETANYLERHKFSFVAKTTSLIQEIKIITGDNQLYLADVILIEDDSPTMQNAILFSDEEEPIITSYVGVAIEMLQRGIVFDLLSPTAFRYDTKRGVCLSIASSFVCISNAEMTPEKNRAFHNFLTMQLLQLIIDNYNATANDLENRPIEWIRNDERFDTRRLDFFVGAEYYQKLSNLIAIIEKYCDVKCDVLRDALSSLNTSDVIKSFKSMANLTMIEHNCEVIDSTKYEIIGNHSEDRISVMEIATGKMGYYDFNFNLVIDFLYDEAADFVEGIAVCEKDDFYGAVNRSGEVIIPFEYEYLEWDSPKNSFLYKVNGELLHAKRDQFLKNRK